MNIRMGCNDTCFCGTFGAGHGPPQLFTSHQGSLDNCGKGSMKMLLLWDFMGEEGTGDDGAGACRIPDSCIFSI